MVHVMVSESWTVIITMNVMTVMTVMTAMTAMTITIAAIGIPDTGQQISDQ